MSMQVTTAFVQQYRNNVFHLSQQMHSRLRPAVRVEAIRGKYEFFERLGSVAAQLRVNRHGDTPQMDTPHSRRRVAMADYEIADYIDDQDKLRMLIDPTSPYAQSQAMAFGRSMDDVLIAAALGNAYSDETGSTLVPLANANKLLAATEAAPATPTNLNVDTLRRIKRYFDANDVDEMIPRYICCSSSQIYALLGSTQVTSADYNSVKALVNGQLDSFMGFKFIRSERLPTADYTYNASTGAIASSGSTLSGGRSVIAWAQDGLLLAVGEDFNSRISERADKSYLTQVYSRMSIGATRLEENKVCEVACKES